MFNGRKVVVTMTSWTKRIGNCVKVIQSILENTVQPDLVFLNLSLAEFPNRNRDLPNDLVELSLKNPRVKINWNCIGNKFLGGSIVFDVRPKTELTNQTIANYCSTFKDDGKLDMSLISVFYDAGVNPLRKVATKKAVANWMKQKHLPKEMMFIELGFNGTFTFSQDDFPKEIVYSRIDGTDANKYLFQKEHLWNIAAKRAKYEKLMFIDSDIAPLNDDDWFGEVYKALDGCLFSQGFSKIVYLDKNDNKTDNIKMSFSYLYSVDKHQKFPCGGVPGGVYCIGKKTLLEIGGFNCIPFGGGDNLFWNEILGLTPRPLMTLFKRSEIGDKMNAMSEEENKQISSDVNITVAHFFHGEQKQRSHKQRHYLLLSQFPIDQLIHDDSAGLLSWVDVGHYFYDVASKLNTVNDDVYIAQSLLTGRFNLIQFEKEFSIFGRDTLQKEELIRHLEKLVENHTVIREVK